MDFLFFRETNVFFIHKVNKTSKITWKTLWH